MFKNYAEESGGLDLLTILGSTVGIIISMLVIWLLCIFSLYIAYKLESLLMRRDRRDRAKICRHEANIKNAIKFLGEINGLPPAHRMSRLKCDITPYVFEEAVLTGIERSGYPVVRGRRYSGDGGIDGKFTVGKVKYFVQSKRYKSYINPRHVKDFDQLCQRHKVRGVFAHTGRTGYRSKDQFTLSDHIELVSGDKLLRLLDGQIKF